MLSFLYSFIFAKNETRVTNHEGDRRSEWLEMEKVEDEETNGMRCVLDFNATNQQPV